MWITLETGIDDHLGEILIVEVEQGKAMTIDDNVWQRHAGGVEEVVVVLKAKESNTPSSGFDCQPRKARNAVYKIGLGTTALVATKRVLRRGILPPRKSRSQLRIV